MKLLIITSLKEDLPQVFPLLKQAGITVFSVTSTTGMAPADGYNLLDDWFGSRNGEFNSAFLFSFTDEASATNAVRLADTFNKSHKKQFPLRAFVLPVEHTNQ